MPHWVLYIYVNILFSSSFFFFALTNGMACVFSLFVDKEKNGREKYLYHVRLYALCLKLFISRFYKLSNLWNTHTFMHTFLSHLSIFFFFSSLQPFQLSYKWACKYDTRDWRKMSRKTKDIKFIFDT